MAISELSSIVTSVTLLSLLVLAIVTATSFTSLTVKSAGLILNNFSDSFIDNTLALLAAISGCEPSLIADLTVKLNSLEIVAKRLFPNGWYAMVIRRVEYTPSFLVDLYNGTAITEFVLLTNQFAPISGLSSVPKLGAFSSKDICPLSSALISSKSAYKS